MGLDPSTLLVLEDAPCGVEAAKAAGMRCIGVATNGRTEALIRAGAHQVIPNFVGLSAKKILGLLSRTNASNPERDPVTRSLANV